MNALLKITLLGLSIGWIAPACGPPYAMEPPNSFKRFVEAKTFQYITADGVMLKGREVENEPEAKLPFWQDALKRHLEANGYVLKGETAIETEGKLKGHNLSFLIPYGAEDWMFNVSIFVDDDAIYILEAAGPYDRYAKIEKDLIASLKTFDPEGN